MRSHSPCTSDTEPTLAREPPGWASSPKRFLSELTKPTCVFTYETRSLIETSLVAGLKYITSGDVSDPMRLKFQKITNIVIRIQKKCNPVIRHSANRKITAVFYDSE